MVARRGSSRDEGRGGGRSGGRDDRGGGGRDRDRGRDDRGGDRDRDRDDRGGRDRGGRDDDRRGGRDREPERGGGRGEDRGSRRNDRDRDDRSDRRTPSRGGGGTSYVYKARDPDATKKKAERQGGAFDSIIKQGFDRWKAKNGDNTIRILPPTWDNFDDCVYTIFVHGYIGPDNSSYLCPRKMKDEPCAICDEKMIAEKAGDKEGAYALRAAERVAMWIVDRDDKADPPVPQFYDMSFRQWQDILKVSMDKKRGTVLTIDDPNEGYDLFLYRTGAGDRTRYSGFSFDRESSALDHDQKVQDDLVQFAVDNPIPDVLNYYDNDYLERIVSGTAPERDKDGDGDRDNDRGGDRDRDDRGGRDRDDRDRGRDDRGGDRDRDPPDDRDSGSGDRDRDPPDDRDRGGDRDRDRDDRGGRGGRGERDRDPPADDNDPPPRRGARDDDGGGRGGRGGGGGERRYRD